MIFSRIFTPAHANRDPAVRQAAIEKLSPHKQQDKAILHELAFNDDNPQVILAALTRLDSFALWQKSAQLARQETVKRSARERVEQTILANDVTEAERQQRDDYLRESAPQDLVKAALLQPVPQLNDTLVLKLLEKVGQAEFTQRYFQRQASAVVKQALIRQADSPSVLDKYAKKEADPQIIADIDARRQTLHQAAHMPAQVQQQITLVLSKLNALLDRADYADITERMDALQQEYAALKPQFDWLSDESIRTTEQKHSQLTAQLERHLARLKPQWQQMQAQLAHQEAVYAAQTQLQQAEGAITALFEEVLVTASVQQVASAQQQLDQAEQAVTALLTLEQQARDDNQQTAKTPTRSAGLSTRLQNLQQQLAGFDDQQRTAQQLAELIQQAGHYDNQHPPQVAEQAQLQQHWQQLSQQLRKVPKALSRQWHQHTKSWQQQHKAAQDQQQQAQRTCRKHLNIVDNLIEQGRFRPAMARFEQARQTFEALSERARVPLQKRYEQTRESVEHLAGWQAYLAAPRKPELLEQAQQLAAQTPDHIGERAARVKDLRAQWQSLVQPGEGSDEQQLAFDVALAAAFEPCRVHFAEQDAKRNAAQQEREALIQQAAALDTQQEPAALARCVEQLRQAWRNAGQADKPTFETLKKQWDRALAPALAIVQQWQATNRDEKQALIGQAQVLLSQDDRAQATEAAKLLQQQWKAIGSAGRHENNLWRHFRKANDALFDAAKQAHQASKQAQQAQADALLEQAGEAVRQLESQDSLTRLQELAGQAADLPPSVQQHVLRKIAKWQTQIEQRQTQQAQQQQQHQRTQQYESLLAAIAQWQGHSSPASEHIDQTLWAALNRAHQQALQEARTVDKSRLWYTTQLEVLCNMPTPDAQSALRQDVQLAMMMHKLEDGQSTTAEQAIVDWLACGPIQTNETPLVKRFNQVIRTCFIASQQDEPRESTS